jgi:hypothetical protein
VVDNENSFFAAVGAALPSIVPGATRNGVVFQSLSLDRGCRSPEYRSYEIKAFSAFWFLLVDGSAEMQTQFV